MPLAHAFDALLENTPAAQALDLELVTQNDLLRLKVLARLQPGGCRPKGDTPG